MTRVSLKTSRSPGSSSAGSSRKTRSTGTGPLASSSREAERSAAGAGRSARPAVRNRNRRACRNDRRAWRLDRPGGPGARQGRSVRGGRTAAARPFERSQASADGRDGDDGDKNQGRSGRRGAWGRAGGETTGRDATPWQADPPLERAVGMCPRVAGRMRRATRGGRGCHAGSGENPPPWPRPPPSNENKPKSVHPSGRYRKLGLTRDIDLALHLPLRYEDETQLTPIAALRDGDIAQVEGVVTDSRGRFRPRRQLVVKLHDAWATILANWCCASCTSTPRTRRRSPGSAAHARRDRVGFFGLEMVHRASRR